MTDIRDELANAFSDPDPVRRAQIQMLKPLPKRFYKDVTVGRDETGAHQILLDGRSVRTPASEAGGAVFPGGTLRTNIALVALRTGGTYWSVRTGGAGDAAEGPGVLVVHLAPHHPAVGDGLELGGGHPLLLPR